jgi:type I restriction enzyme, R subunit
MVKELQNGALAQVKGMVRYRMVRLNPTRIDYLAQLQQLIDAYNAGRLDMYLFFEKLLQLAQSLSAEEQRGIAAARLQHRLLRAKVPLDL